MFVRILRDSLFRQKRRKAVVLFSVALGTAAAAALGDMALDVGDKVSRELKAFGANLVVVPRESARPIRIGGEDVSSLRLPSYLPADQVLKVKDNFWKNNILAFAPVLDLRGKARGRTFPVLGTWFERPIALDSGSQQESPTGIRSLNTSHKPWVGSIYTSLMGISGLDISNLQSPETRSHVCFSSFIAHFDHFKEAAFCINVSRYRYATGFLNCIAYFHNSTIRRSFQ